MKKVFSTNKQAVEAFGDGNNEAKCGSIYAQDNILYSYGSHFPMAIRFNDFYLINADKYSVTTSAHQSLCIGILDPNIQIPFSALSSAGIDPKKLNLVDSKEDKWTEEKYTDPKTGEKKTRDVHHLGMSLIKSKDSQYLSGFDSQESFRFNSYFLTKLSSNDYLTCDEALQGLKPSAVIEADRLEIPYKRHGEWFLIESDFSARDIRKFTVLIGKMHPIIPLSTHIATEVREIVNPSKKTYKNVVDLGARIVRGTIRHRPPNRRQPQHGMLTLGKKWHRVIKNTALDSWQSQGGVD